MVANDSWNVPWMQAVGLDLSNLRTEEGSFGWAMVQFEEAGERVSLRLLLPPSMQVEM